MTVRVDLTVVVAVMTGRDGIKVDAGVLDGRLGLGPITLRVVARDPAPGLHRTGAPRAPARPALTARRARYACMHRV
jgi:hypothetical protein